MKLHRDLATLFSVALMIGSTLVASASPAAAAAPTNDNFASADALPSTASGSVTGSNLDATRETSEPSSLTATVWWSWTAPADGIYLFETCGTPFDSGLAVYGGSTLSTLVDVSAYAGYCYFEHNWFTNEQMTLTASAGVTYFVQVGAYQDGMGTVSLRWWAEQKPANDDIGSPTALTGGTGSTTGTTRFATVDVDNDIDYRGSPSVWFTWTPPAAGLYVFDTCGSTFDTILGAYTLTPETPIDVAFGDDTCVWESAITIDATMGELYYIGVAGYDPESFGDFVLHWRAEAIPGNDDFANATPIGGTNGTATGNGIFSTSEYDEPFYTTGSIWWRWTAPAAGMVVFDTCDSTFDTKIIVYTGDIVAPTSVGQDDDGCFYESMVGFEATEGTQYSIMVYSTSGVLFDVVLHWQMGVPPVNDDFANASALSGAGGTLQTSTLFSTWEEGEAAVANRPYTVWWTWMAPADGQVTFDTCGSSGLGDHVLGVYTGSAVNALSQIALGSADGTCGYTGSAVTFWANAGMTYHIAFGSYSMGDLVLHWPASGVVGAPTVSTHPQPTTVTAGSTATFTAAAAGIPVPTVQWQRLTTDPAAVWTDVGGATSTTLNVPTTYAMNDYQYRAVFTNSVASATSDPATLTVNPFAPQITSNPGNNVVLDGTVVTFTAAASGDPAPTVQWQVRTPVIGAEWTNVADATSTTLSFTAAYADSGNQYRAVFTNPGGSATSSLATLTVTPNVSVTDLAATVSRGKVTVTFTPTGTPEPTYFQCEFLGKGSKGGWVPCSSGDVFKVSAKYVAVHAGYSASGPWGPAMSTPIGRAAK